MKHKSRLFSVAALGAAAVLVIGSTVYRAKADDVVAPTDPATAVGTGYAGGEVAEVTGLTTQSYGTFNYDAGEGGDNITIASSDISNLARATKALSTQMVALGDAAKLADDETKAAVNDKMVAVDASLNSISNTLSTLQDRMTTFESNYAPSVARCYSMFNLNAPSGLTVTPETSWQNAQPDANYNSTTGVVKVGTIFKKTNTVPTLTLGNMGKVVTTVSKSPTGNPENIDLTKYHYTGQATETRTYTLDGWYTAASGGTKVYEPNATYTQTIDEDIFYAHYNETISYTYLYTVNIIETPFGKVDPSGLQVLSGGGLADKFAYPNTGKAGKYVIWSGIYGASNLPTEKVGDFTNPVDKYYSWDEQGTVMTWKQANESEGLMGRLRYARASSGYANGYKYSLEFWNGKNYVMLQDYSADTGKDGVYKSYFTVAPIVN